jgi:hypothetical protein
MLSLFYTLHKSLTNTLGLLSLLESSLAVAWERLPIADFHLPQGSETVPGLSYQLLTTTEPQQSSKSLNHQSTLATK